MYYSHPPVLKVWAWPCRSLITNEDLCPPALLLYKQLLWTQDLIFGCSGVTSNFGPSRRISKMGPQSPISPYMAWKWASFCLGPPQLRVLWAPSYTTVWVTHLAHGEVWRRLLEWEWDVLGLSWGYCLICLQFWQPMVAHARTVQVAIGAILPQWQWEHSLMKLLCSIVYLLQLFWWFYYFIY